MAILCLAASSACSARDRWDAPSQQHHARRQCADTASATRTYPTASEAARNVSATRRDTLACVASALSSLCLGPASANSLRDFLQSRQRIYVLAPIYSSEHRLAVLSCTPFNPLPHAHHVSSFRVAVPSAGDAAVAERSTGRSGDAPGVTGRPKGVDELLYVRGELSLQARCFSATHTSRGVKQGAAELSSYMTVVPDTTTARKFTMQISWVWSLIHTLPPCAAP